MQTTDQAGSSAVLDVAVPSSALNPFAFPRSSDDAVKSAKILIVDDEPAVVQLIGTKLQEAGFTNCKGTADSGRAARYIPMLMPDLVLLDWRMRPVNGEQILQALRGNDRTKNIPVIVVTTADDELTAVRALNLGATDFVSKPVRASELVARTRNTLSAKVYRDLATQRAVQLQSDMLSDTLTGIANRRAFEYEIKRRMTEWNRQRTPLGLAMVDLDRFKTINDRYGHRIGDSVLRGVAQIITNATRSMDLVARYGGEEIAIILPSTTFSETKEVAERARAMIEAQRFTLEGHELSITVSIGIANAMNGDDAELFIRRADTALYTSKKKGRNCVCYHDGGSCHPITDRPAAYKFEEKAVNQFPRSETHGLELAKIAIVDDEPSVILVAQKYLKEAGFSNFVTIEHAESAIATIELEDPDLVILDIHMPGKDGLQILKELRSSEATSSTPVLIFTSDKTSDAKVDALGLGASDFLRKPIDASELSARVRNTLMAKSRMDDLSDYSQRLEYEVQLRTTELSASRREAIQCLARAAELRDDHTGRHVIRVGRYAAIIAEELGFSDERVVWVEMAAQLHDVGKIGIPDSILNKPGSLTSEEYEVMKSHCVNGTRIIRDNAESADDGDCHTLAGVDVFEDCNSPIMRMAALVANTHHEKWDGSGYPRGLAGKEIPIEGRITAVADVFDALSTRRPYKEAIELDECFRMIEEGRGSHFDPDVVDAFLARKAEIRKVAEDYSD